MDNNNKQQRTDLNQEAANKIPTNRQENKINATQNDMKQEQEAAIQKHNEANAQQDPGQKEEA